MYLCWSGRFGKFVCQANSFEEAKAKIIAYCRESGEPLGTIQEGVGPGHGYGWYIEPIDIF